MQHSRRSANACFLDVDYCFTAGRMLVMLDMKSKQRNLAYHRGGYGTIRGRQKELVRDLQKDLCVASVIGYAGKSRRTRRCGRLRRLAAPGPGVREPAAAA